MITPSAGYLLMTRTLGRSSLCKKSFFITFCYLKFLPTSISNKKKLMKQENNFYFALLWWTFISENPFLQRNIIITDLIIRFLPWRWKDIRKKLFCERVNCIFCNFSEKQKFDNSSNFCIKRKIHFFDISFWNRWTKFYFQI